MAGHASWTSCMSSKSWNLRGPLPSTDPTAIASFKATVRQLYTDVDHSEALVPLVEALSPRLEAAGRTSLWVFVEWCLATRLAILGQYSVAEPRIAAALARASPADSPDGYLNLLNLRGLICKFQGDYAGAIDTQAAQLRVVREHRLHGLGMTGLTNLAYTLMEMGCSLQAADVLADHTDLLEHSPPNKMASYHAARLTCADALNDDVTARAAIHTLDTLLQRGREDGATVDPSAQAVARTLGPTARLPEHPTHAQWVSAGTQLLLAAITHTRFMPGYRLKAAAECARIALRLDQPDLALQLVDLGRSVQPDDLPIAWAIALEDIAASVHEARGELAPALAATRKARALERKQAQSSLSSAVQALLARVDEDSEHLRAVELEQVNRALRTTTERLDAALAEASTARVQAERAADARHRFLSRMSHELRTPLQGVTGGIELLQETALSSEQTELVALLAHSTRLTQVIVDDILEVGKLETGTLHVIRQPVHLSRLVGEALATVHTRAKAQGTTLRHAVDPDLPPRVQSDRRHLLQVLLNLLSNAVKYTPGGHVDLLVERAGTSIAFSVHDTGCGIEPDELASIFDPYVRTDRSEGLAVEGSGLGLAIAHGIVQAMEGSLTAHSTPGVGSTFRLTLPLIPVAPEPARPEPPAGTDLHGIRVLVAEDNAISQVVLRRHLRALGTIPHIVPDGRAALEHLDSHAYDVVILDFHMPGVGGLEVSRRLRQQGSTLPIIGLTASALPEDEEAARAAHMDAYATKPVTRRRLESLMRGVLRDAG